MRTRLSASDEYAKNFEETIKRIEIDFLSYQIATAVGFAKDNPQLKHSTASGVLTEYEMNLILANKVANVKEVDDAVVKLANDRKVTKYYKAVTNQFFGMAEITRKRVAKANANCYRLSFELTEFMLNQAEDNLIPINQEKLDRMIDDANDIITAIFIGKSFSATCKTYFSVLELNEIKLNYKHTAVKTYAVTQLLATIEKFLTATTYDTEMLYPEFEGIKIAINRAARTNIPDLTPEQVEHERKPELSKRIESAALDNLVLTIFKANVSSLQDNLIDFLENMRK